ncbi:MAG: hypothetical protein H4O13_02120 [Xanthomonadales bacterium]|nr:hypothetical protein [Xanthomonadales bacterium]
MQGDHLLLRQPIGSVELLGLCARDGVIEQQAGRDQGEKKGDSGKPWERVRLTDATWGGTAGDKVRWHKPGKMRSPLSGVLCAAAHFSGDGVRVRNLLPIVATRCRCGSRQSVGTLCRSTRAAVIADRVLFCQRLPCMRDSPQPLLPRPAVDALVRPLLPAALAVDSAVCGFEPGSAGHTLWLIARQRAATLRPPHHRVPAAAP